MTERGLLPVDRRGVWGCVCFCFGGCVHLCLFVFLFVCACVNERSTLRDISEESHFKGVCVLLGGRDGAIVSVILEFGRTSVLSEWF